MHKRLDRSIDLGPFVAGSDDDMIICRCEEITKGEIRKAVHEGMFTTTEIRRFLRTGMGLCQGQTCGNLVRRIVATELGVKVSEIEYAVARAPFRPIAMKTLANELRRGQNDK